MNTMGALCCIKGWNNSDERQLVNYLFNCSYMRVSHDSEGIIDILATRKGYAECVTLVSDNIIFGR